MNETCEGCRFWRAHEVPETNRGYCHRHAPRWGQGGMRAQDDWFPEVPKFAWCGDFEASK